MNKFKTIFGYFLVAMVLVTSASYSQTKRVIIEDHTGTWCGYCVNGITAMEELKSIYKDQVFPVAVHNGDPMKTTHQDTLAGIFSIKGYPSGSLDRLLIGSTGSIWSNPNTPDGKGGTWGVYVDEILKMNAESEVEVTKVLDAANRQLTITVTATVLSEIKAQTALNAMVLEDNVTGVGQTWQQVNYYSSASPSGPAGTSSHPWYNKPYRVTMDHDHVLRTYLGGVLGDRTGINATLKAGDVITKTFVYRNIPSDYNLDNLQVIGFHQYFALNGNNLTRFNIINSSSDNVPKGSGRATLVSTDPGVDAVAGGTTKDRVWECKNLSETPSTFKITVKKSARTPSNWEATVDQGTVQVAGGASANCKLTFKTGNMMGVGDAEVTIEDGKNFKKTFTYTLVSNDLPRMEIKADANIETNYIQDKVNSQQFAMYGLTTTEASQVYQKLNSLKTVVYSTGAAGQMSKDDADMCSYFLNKKVNIFINGAFTIPALLANVTGAGLPGELGLNWVNANNNLNKITSAQTTFGLKGIDNDPISSGFVLPSTTLQQNYFPQSLSIINPSIAKTMLTLTSTLYPNNPVMAARGELMGARFVVLSINPIHIPASLREDFLNKTMLWLENVEAAPEPIVITNKSTMNYGTIAVGTSKTETVTITNDGKAKLTLSGANFAFDGEAGYTLGENYKFPIVLDPGQSTDLAVKFTPKNTEEATDNLQIETNDKKRPQVSISLSGKGSAASVRDGVEGVFSVNLTNNPIIAGTKLNYTIGGNTNTNVSIQLVDASGAVVANLVNSAQGPGAYSIDLNHDNLAAGAYFIIARANGITAKLNAVVSK